MIVEINDNNIEQILSEASVPVIVEFGAPWCTYCNKMLPIIEKISEDKKDSVIVGKVNTDVSPEIVARFKIRSLPTFISFINNEQHKKVIGAVSMEELLNMIV